MNAPSIQKIAVLSLDVEDWYHLDYLDRQKCNRSFSMLDGLGRFRELLQTERIASSCFVLGELAKSLATELRQLAAEGHDIGSHGWNHLRPLTMPTATFRADIERTKAEIEDVIGQYVVGYRAPCFSLDRNRLDMVQESGYLYDSSRIAFKDHPLYGTLDMSGYAELSPHIFRREEFFEFEVSTLEIGRKCIPVSGGGYLRIFPWLLMRTLLNRYLAHNALYTLYIHPFELSLSRWPSLPDGTRSLTRFRFRCGRAGVLTKLTKLIGLLREHGFQFSTFSALRRQWVGAACVES